MTFRFNALVPEPYVSDLPRSLAFYTEILGFVVEYERDNPPFNYLSLGERQLMLQEVRTGDFPDEHLQHPFGRGVNFQIECPDIVALHRSLTIAGIPLVRGIEEKVYRVSQGFVRANELQVMDPDGYLLRFAETIQP